MIYDHLYLSPHLDDIPLSCGGRVWQQTQRGESVLILVITAGDPPLDNLPPFADGLHRAWGIAHESPVATRREEDSAANTILGALYEHWPLFDCIYRHNPRTGEPIIVDEEGLFGAASRNVDEAFVADIAARLANYEAHNVYVPLAIGSHIDHWQTRYAAERVFDNLLYYEDTPYVHTPGSLYKVIGSDSAWRARSTALSEAALNAKLEACAAYPSQMPWLFGDDRAMRRDITNYVQLVGGERLWWR